MSKTLEEARDAVGTDRLSYLDAALDRLEKLEKAIEAHERVVNGPTTTNIQSWSANVPLWDALKEDP